MSRNSTKSNIQCCGVTQAVPFSKTASEILSYPEHKKIVESQGVSRSALGFNLDPRFVYPVDPGNVFKARIREMSRNPLNAVLCNK